MTSDMQEALAACPFCGERPGTTSRPDSSDETRFFAAVMCYCGGYSVCAHKMAVADTRAEAEALAAAEWNRRAAQPSNDTREALAALMVIAAECAQRKPLRGFEELTEATHIGHRQFGRAHEQADEAVRMLAVRLRAVFDTLAVALATQPAKPSSMVEAWPFEHGTDEAGTLHVAAQPSAQGEAVARKPMLDYDALCTAFCAKWSGNTKVEAGDVLDWIMRQPLASAPAAPASAQGETVVIDNKSARIFYDDLRMALRRYDAGTHSPADLVTAVQIALAVVAPAAQPSAQGEAVAWLVEWKAHGHGPQWWGFNHTPGKNATWCSDANNAIRFARKEDAERMRLHIIAVAGLTGVHEYERSVSVTEHMWEGPCRAN